MVSADVDDYAVTSDGQRFLVKRPLEAEEGQRIHVLVEWPSLLEKLGDDVGSAVVCADVVDGEDVGVVQSGDGPGLLLEAAETVGVGGDLGAENLDRDPTPEPRVTGAVDLPHAAGPEKTDDLVRPKTRGGRQCHNVSRGS